MDRFIARENIKHFRDRLSVEIDLDMRSRLHKLLVAEEDKLGADFELLADVERHIADGNRRIKRQRAIVTDMQRDGHDGLVQARVLLESLMDSQLLSKNYRRRILMEITQNGL
jgi:hypothetical protein